MKTKVIILGLASLLVLCFTKISWAAAEKVPIVGPVKINAHPASLEGKVVVLRWNGKMNGDKFLTRIGELLTQQVKGVKIVKLWETDRATAAISKDGEASEDVAKKIANLKPEMFLRAVEAMMIGKITMKEPGNFGFEVAESQKTSIKF